MGCTGAGGWRVHLGKYMRVNERPLHRRPPCLPRAGALPVARSQQREMPCLIVVDGNGGHFSLGGEGWNGGRNETGKQGKTGWEGDMGHAQSQDEGVKKIKGSCMVYVHGVTLREFMSIEEGSPGRTVSKETKCPLACQPGFYTRP